MPFEPAEWTPDLAKVRDSLAYAFHRISSSHQRPVESGRQVSGRREGTIALSLGDDNTLIAPVTLIELPDGRRGPPKVTILGFTLVRLDPAVMRDTLLASLTARHFHGDDEGVDYRVAVVDRNDSSKVVWESEPGVATSIVASPDVTQHFMAARPDQMFIFARSAGPRERPFRGGHAATTATAGSPGDARAETTSSSR